MEPHPVYFGIAEEDEELLRRGRELHRRGVAGARRTGERPNVRRLTPSALARVRRLDGIRVASARSAAPPRPGAFRSARPSHGAVPNPSAVRVHLVLPAELQRRAADRRQVQALDPGDPEPAERRRGSEAADRLRERPHLRARRRHAAVADKDFLLTPRNVEVSAEQRAQLLERGGFYNQA